MICCKISILNLVDIIMNGINMQAFFFNDQLKKRKINWAYNFNSDRSAFQVYLCSHVQSRTVQHNIYFKNKLLLPNGAGVQAFMAL